VTTNQTTSEINQGVAHDLALESGFEVLIKAYQQLLGELCFDVTFSLPSPYGGMELHSGKRQNRETVIPYGRNKPQQTVGPRFLDVQLYERASIQVVKSQ